MNEKNNGLELNTDISRRQFIDGAGVALGALAVAAVPGAEMLVPQAANAATLAAGSRAYPPSLQGIRGQTDASFAVAHALRDGHVFPVGAPSGEHYDLVIAGAGMSGLSAAYFYRKAQPHAKILVLDNCDDFGGHARRNEYDVDGRTVIARGGTYMVMLPGTYTPEGKALLADIGFDKERCYKNAAEDQSRLAGLGLGVVVFFDKETYGRDVLVGGYPGFTRIEAGSPAERAEVIKAWQTFLAASPLSSKSTADLLRIVADDADLMPGLSIEQKIERLRSISYSDYLAQYLGTGGDALRFIQAQAGSIALNVGSGPDSFSAWMAYGAHYPGFTGLGLPQRPLSGVVPDGDTGNDVELPDGNAGIARLIVRWLIPSALPGTTMEDSVVQRVDYAKLDVPQNDVRIRLSSTVTHVRHEGDPAQSQAVTLSYVRDGKSYSVNAGACVLACFNSVIPYICPELPEPQKDALKLAVRKPLIWATVALRNWRAFAQEGAYVFYAPGSFFQMGLLDPGHSLGANKAAQGPDDPAVVTMIIAPDAPGMPQRDQYRAGRAELLGIDLETYERNARQLLQRMFRKTPFNAARDIAGITINRWAHGYAGGLNDLYDPRAEGEPVFVQARKRFGRIAIANSDASGVSMTQAAFDQANRAVRELLSDVVRPEFYIKNPERG